MTEILNTYCLRTILKNYKIYHFTCKVIKEFHSYHVQKYLRKQIEGEIYLPLINRISTINELVSHRGYLFRQSDEHLLPLI